MKITESQLRKIIKEEITSRLAEAETAAAGKEDAKDVKGTLDVKKIADTLKVDATKLKTAVTNLKSGKRNSADNQILGDVFASLMSANPEDTTKVMVALKKVEGDKEEK